MEREARTMRKDLEAYTIARKSVERPKLSNEDVFVFVFGVQEAPRWIPKPLKKQEVSPSAAKSFQNHPRSGEESRTTPQEHPKNSPTAPQSRPRAIKSSPRAAKSTHEQQKSGQDAAKRSPRATQERPRAPQKQPRAPQERPESTPRAPRQALENTKITPREPTHKNFQKTQANANTHTHTHTHTHTRCLARAQKYLSEHGTGSAKESERFRSI